MKMPISEKITDRQRDLINGIKQGMAEGKKDREIAKDLAISHSYVEILKGKASLTKPGSEVLAWAEKDKWLSDWVAECRAKRTKYGYAAVMKGYCAFRDMTPTELLREAEADNKKPFEDKTLKHELIKYRTYLREKHINEITIKSYQAAIMSFFRFNGVSLPEIRNGGAKSANQKNEYDRKKLRELLSVCNTRERAIFLTMFQSGLASNEISNLRMRDLDEVQDGITILKLQRQKSKTFFTTFIGKDGTQALNDYLKVRNKGNLMPGRPDISQLAKVESKEDYVFVTWDSTKHVWGKITTAHISRYMLNACQKLGWEIKTEGIKKYNPNRPHALRSSFASICVNEGRIPKFFVDTMMGHSLNAVDLAYFNAKKNELFKFYKEGEYLLSVSDLEKIPDSRYEELMIELHARNGKISELEEKVTAMEAREEARAPGDKGVAAFLEAIDSKPEMKKAMIKVMASDSDMKNVVKDILKELMGETKDK
jgi:integrase